MRGRKRNVGSEWIKMKVIPIALNHLRTAFVVRQFRNLEEVLLPVLSLINQNLRLSTYRISRSLSCRGYGGYDEF